MLKTSASSGKAEVKAKVEAKMKKVRSSLNLNLAQPSSDLTSELDGLFEHPMGQWAVNREEPIRRVPPGRT